MDVLGDILRVLRLRGSVYFNDCPPSPWGIAKDASSQATFHLIVRGDAWLQMKSQAESIKLSAGDIVLLPTSAPHIICDAPDSECPSEHHDIAAYQLGRPLLDGEQSEFNILCGYVEFDSSLSTHL